MQRAGLTLLAITLVLFLPTLLSYPDAWRSATYNHGYLVAVATVWLIWRERASVRKSALAGATWPPATLAAAALSFAWLFAMVTNVQSVHQTLLPVILLAWSGGVLGRDAARRLWPITGVFLLAVPIWEVFIPPLRELTVLAATTSLRLVHVPAVIEGNVVHIQYGSFVIANGCAGLSYRLSGLTIGALYSQLESRTRRSRIAVIALAAGLAIVGNWIRVASLIMIGNVTEMRSGLVDDHLTYGWAIFLGGLVVFFPLAGRVHRRDAANVRTDGMHDPATRDARATAESADRDPVWLRRAVLTTVAAIVGPVIYLSFSSMPTREPAAPTIPASSTTWEPTPQPAGRPYQWRPAFAAAAEHLSDSWTSGDQQVLVDRFVYRDQRQGAELVGYGNRIAANDALIAERVIGSLGPRGRLVNEALVRSENEVLLVWYWYRVGGAETESAVRSKLLGVVAFFKRTPRAELIAVSTGCASDSCERASEALSSFMGWS